MSFMRKKKKGNEDNQKEAYMRKPNYMSGSHVDQFVLHLVILLGDDNHSVTENAARSLQIIGLQRYNVVFGYILDLLRSSKKIAPAHKLRCLETMNSLAHSVVERLQDELARDLVQYCSREMTQASGKEKAPTNPVSKLCCDTLVQLSKNVPSEVLQSLFSQFERGTIPHVFIVKALGDLSEVNPDFFINNMEDVFARILPILGVVKSEALKACFGDAFTNFCEALDQHMHMEEEEGVPRKLDGEAFQTQIYTVFDLLMQSGSWVDSKETAVRASSAMAVGSLCSVMDERQFKEQFPQLIIRVLSFYKRAKSQEEFAAISTCLRNILERGVETSEEDVNENLMNILSAIFPPCVSPEIDPNASAKNCNELLQCFEVIASKFATDVIGFLVSKLEMREERAKLNSLGIFRHIVTRLKEPMEGKKELVIAGIRNAYNDSTLRVQKVFVQLISAMAVNEYLILEGSLTLIENLVRIASTREAVPAQKSQKKKKDGLEIVNPSQLKQIGGNVLRITATTIPGMSNVYWPTLFEMLIPSTYIGAFSVVTKCLVHIAKRKSDIEAPDYMIDFDKEVNIPKPEAIVVKLVTIAQTSPQDKFDDVEGALVLLNQVNDVLHPSISDVCEKNVPKLLEYLQENSWNSDREWREKVQGFVGELLSEIGDEDWLKNFLEELFKQMSDAPNRELKICQLETLGIALKSTRNRELVRKDIDALFQRVNHENYAEGESCAIAIGNAAAIHFDLVLEVLHMFLKTHTKERGFKKKKVETQAPTSTIMLTFGYICEFSPKTLVTSRLESQILNAVLPILTNQKASNFIKVASFKATEKISRSIHPKLLDAPYNLRNRARLIEIIFEVMATVPPKDIADGFRGIANLVLLSSCTEELETEIGNSTLRFFTAALRDGVNVADVRQGVESVFDSLLHNSVTVRTLMKLLSMIRPNLQRPDSLTRKHSVFLFKHITRKFVEYTEKNKSSGDLSLEGCGLIVGWLLPRCVDADVSIRQSAMEVLVCVLFIDHLLMTDPSAGFSLRKRDEHTILSSLSDEMDVYDEIEFVEKISRIGELLSKLTRAAELPDTLYGLLEAVQEPTETSASSSAIMLHCLFKLRGEELRPVLPALTPRFVAALDGVKSGKAFNGMLNALSTLSRFHTLEMLKELMEFNLPFGANVKKSLQIIAQNESAVDGVIDNLTETMNSSSPYFDVTDEKGERKRSAAIPPNKSAAALAAILQRGGMKDVLEDNYPRIVSSILLRIGNAHTSRDASHIEVAVETLKILLKEEGREGLSMILTENVCDQLFHPSYAFAMETVVNTIAEVHPEQIRGICAFLFPFLSKSYEGLRITSTTVYATFVCHIGGQPKLLEQTLQCLHSRLADESELVRIMAIRGLGNIVYCGRDEVNKHSSSILNAFTGGMESNSNAISVESMDSLKKILTIIDEEYVEHILINTALRIRNIIRKPVPDVRKSGFSLYGSMCRFGNQIVEQIHDSIPYFIVYLQDEDKLVVEECSRAALSIFPILDSEPLEMAIANKISSGGDLTIPFENICSDVAKALVESFPERANYYLMQSVDLLKSDEWFLRAASSLLTAYMISSYTEEKRLECNISAAATLLIELLKDKDPRVRAEAALAVSMLHDV